MRLNLHLLRVFHSVATESSFSAAARFLHISQPAVSKAVSELERQLDMVLIERRGGRAGQTLTLTEAGEALNAHARAIFAFERAAVDDLHQRSGLRQGQLVIGASTTIASYWLPRYLQAFASKWPDITMRVVVGNTQSIAEDLFDCRLDLALVEGPVHVDGLTSWRWKNERLVIVGSPTMPQPTTIGQLADRTWLLREVGSGTREVFFDFLTAHGLRLQRSLEIGSNEGIARAAASGLGVAMLPFVVVEDLLSLGRLVELRLTGVEALTRRLYRVQRQHRPPSPAAHAFLEVLNDIA